MTSDDEGRIPKSKGKPHMGPSGKKILTNKLVFRIKRNEDGNTQKCKARLVARKHVQKKFIDCDEILASVARLDTIRTVLAILWNTKWISLLLIFKEYWKKTYTWSSQNHLNP